ncbi:hypothetical protein GQ53DRAFT_763804 [Thozetella sp. PMI_491]|nr:hypothetical protein GQ53DRAFT_763804 [Thozetella sp. PMI_491]
MPEVYRETRYTRERDTSPSDEEYKKTTVRRYKVTPSRVERVERVERDVIEDDHRSHYSAHLAGPGRSSQADLLEVDRRVERVYVPERPRSAFDPAPRQRDTVVERVERDRSGDEYYSRHEYRDERPRHGGIVERERIVEREERDPISDKRSVIERVEREERDLGDRHRTTVERQVVERDSREDDIYRIDDRDRERGRVVYEKTKEVDRVEGPFSPRDRDRRDLEREWEHRSVIASRDRDEVDVRVDKRVERREDGEIRVERRFEERREDGYGSGAEVERYRKETEYYEPAPQVPPIVIRQRAPEQKIIVQEAPAPATIVLPQQDPRYTVVREQQETREIARRDRDPRDLDHEDEYYYRRESREVGPYRGDRREEEYAVERYDRRGDRHHHHHRHHRHRDEYSESEPEDDYYVRRTIVRRERSKSGSPHHKRHLAEGALAGAGIAGLLTSRRNGGGELPEHRGRKVLAGAALGALGTEVVKRARSAYNDRYGDDDDRRERSRSRGGHSRLRTGLGIAAVALAAAGAAKYYQSSKVEKEEMSRGRSLHRASSGEFSRSVSRKRSRSRAASVAKAAVGTAAVAGLVNHFRNKSKARDGKERSKSRVRTGAGIVAAGLAGAAGKKIYDNIQDRKERKREEEEEEVSRARSRSRRAHSRTSYSDDSEYEREYRHRRHDSRSRSRSLSRSGRPLHPPPPAADPELGLVEYGAHPLYSEPGYPPHPAGARDGYVSAEEERRDRRRGDGRRHRGDDYRSESESEREGAKKKRSRSRLRDMAAAAAGAGAAAIGIKKYNDSKKEKEEKKEREKRSHERDYSSDRDRDDDRRHRDGHRDRDRHHDRYHDRDHDRDRDRDRERDSDRERELARERERRRYEDEISAAEGYDDVHRHGGRTPSPPHASGGAYYPPPAGGPAPPAAGFTQHPNTATTNLGQEFHAYNPQEYSGFPPPPPGHPPHPAALNPGVPPAGPPPPAAGGRMPSPPPMGPDHSKPVGPGDSTEGERSRDANKGLKPPPAGHPGPSGSDNETDDLSPTAATKSVIFIPLSPQSSRTLRRHHAEQDAHRAHDEDGGRDLSHGDDNPDADAKSVILYHPDRNATTNPRRRRGSDPSSNRPVIQRRRSRGEDSPDSELSEDEIEILPDRFDAHGRPLDHRGRPVGGLGGRAGDSRWHSRRGDFEYRSPKGPGGWDVQGQWGVAGTDPEAVERIVRGVTGAIEAGRGGWMGLLGGLLNGLQAPPDDHGHRHGDEADDEGEEGRRHRHRHVRDREQRRITEEGESSRHGGGRHRDRGRDRDDDDGYDGDEAPRSRRWWKRKQRDD